MINNTCHYIIAVLSLQLVLLTGCSERKFHAVAISNVPFIPDTAFAGYEDLSMPKFQALKEKYRLDTIFHGETGELQRILLLRNWISKTIRIDNTGPYPGDGSPGSILDEALKGHGFHCGHYTEVQNAVLNAYGYITRCLLADVGVPVDPIEGEGHHAINEVWLNTYHKWFLSDAKYDYHFEKNGIPLSALEIRDEYLRNKAEDIVLVKGPGRIVTAIYPELKNRTKEKFARIYTWLSWGKYNSRYSQWHKINTDHMVVYEDAYFKNHTWLWDGKPFWAYHTEYMTRVRDRKAIEWTPNTITSTVKIAGNTVRIELHSVTPNLKNYQMKEVAPIHEDTLWKDVSNIVTIALKNDTNEMMFRTKNLAGVTGPEHKIVVAR